MPDKAGNLNTNEKLEELEFFYAKLGRIVRTKRTGNYDFKVWVETIGRDATLEIEFSVDGSQKDHDKLIGRAKTEIRKLHNVYLTIGGLAPIPGLKMKVKKKT